MLWSEWLESHKRKANSDCLLLLSRQYTMQQLCIGWRNSTVHFHLTGDTPNDGDLKSIAWCLSEYSVSEVAAKSGLQACLIRGLMKQAAAIDMIYPDGTLNDSAGKLLSGIMAREIKGAVR